MGYGKVNNFAAPWFVFLLKQSLYYSIDRV